MLRSINRQGVAQIVEWIPVIGLFRVAAHHDQGLDCMVETNSNLRLFRFLAGFFYQGTVVAFLLFALVRLFRGWL